MLHLVIWRTNSKFLMKRFTFIDGNLNCADGAVVIIRVESTFPIVKTKLLVFFDTIKVIHAFIPRNLSGFYVVFPNRNTCRFGSDAYSLVAHVKLSLSCFRVGNIHTSANDSQRLSVIVSFDNFPRIEYPHPVPHFVLHSSGAFVIAGLTL